MPAPHHIGPERVVPQNSRGPLPEGRGALGIHAVAHRDDHIEVVVQEMVLGIFRRLFNVVKQVWAKGRPKRESTPRDWVEENHFNRGISAKLDTQTIAR